MAFDCSLWVGASKSYIDLIQRCQNIAIKIVTAAYRVERNNALRRDMMLATVASETKRFASKHELKLGYRANPMSI